ncbi:hypothetical protein ACFB49_35880 [Sphingomonas sp. DBB INV C78]|uniref:hypothetical protein n=1 Tax=Sphingomonas sp. DBB INV C78 TaxID=3349434 RepID=UPI0036D2642F
MRTSGLLGLLAATAIVASPVAAQTARSSAAALSLSGQTRAAAPMQKVSRGEGDNTWLIVGGVVAAGILLWLILDDDDDDEPVSA